MEAFPNLPPAARERLAARGIDIEQSFRDFLAGMVGEHRVEQVIDQAAQEPTLPLPPGLRRELRQRDHGTYARYKAGCRCHGCRAANADYIRLWKMRRAA